MPGAPVVALALAGALAVSPAAFAQVYKWTDERGVVNYSNTPPPSGRTGKLVDEDSGRVSTIPGMGPRDTSGAKERALQERVDRLERESAAARQTAAANELAAQEAWRRWYEQCHDERRVDCDNPYSPAHGPVLGFGAPPVIVRPPFRPVRPLLPGPGEFRPTPFVAEGGGGVVGPYYRPPVGGIAAGPGPYGIGGGYQPAPPGGVVVAPGPGGVGAQYVPVPPQSLPAGRPMQRPRAATQQQ